MRRTHRVALIGLFLATTIAAVHLGAQTPAAAVRQVAFLNASTPRVGAHFGCGGALDAGAVYVFAFDNRGGTF